MMLEPLMAKAEKEGWAAGSGSMAQIRRNAAALGWTDYWILLTR
jgi:hypothetical protein